MLVILNGWMIQGNVERVFEPVGQRPSRESRRGPADKHEGFPSPSHKVHYIAPFDGWSFHWHTEIA